MATRQRTDLIVVHCSATRPGQDVGRQQIEEWHVSRGFSSIGYHFVVRRNGSIELGRPLEEIGAHVAGHNANSVGVCLVGGLEVDGREPATPHALHLFTDQQLNAARDLIGVLRRVYPKARVVGHRDLSPDLNGDGKIERREWLKSCPSIDVALAFPV